MAQKTDKTLFSVSGIPQDVVDEIDLDAQAKFMTRSALIAKILTKIYRRKRHRRSVRASSIRRAA